MRAATEGDVEKGEASRSLLIFGCIAGMAALIATAILLPRYTPFDLNASFIGGMSAAMMGLLVTLLRSRKIERLDPKVAAEVKAVLQEVTAERRRLPGIRPTRADQDSIQDVEKALETAYEGLALMDEREAARQLHRLPDLTEGWDQSAELTQRLRSVSTAADTITGVLDRNETALRGRPGVRRRMREMQRRRAGDDQGEISTGTVVVGCIAGTAALIAAAILMPLSPPFELSSAVVVGLPASIMTLLAWTLTVRRRGRLDKIPQPG